MAGDDRMSNEDYLATQNQISLYAGLLRELPLAGFLERLGHAESVGPLLDPTLYRDALASGKLDLLRGTAEALRRAQVEIAKIEARHEAVKPRETT